MAVRSFASATGDNSGALTATPAGVVAGDYLGMFVCNDTTVGWPFGYTGGWVQQFDAGLSLQEQQGGAYADCIATGSDVFTGGPNATALICVALSGRNTGGTLAASKSFLTGTRNDVSLTTPVSVALTGGTATAGDDLLFFCQGDPGHNADVWNFSTVSGFTNELNALTDGSSQVWATFQHQDNVSAGATGTLNSTLTRTSGANTMQGTSGVVIAVQAASSVGPLLWAQGMI